jgi:hypothetical protein
MKFHKIARMSEPINGPGAIGRTPLLSWMLRQRAGKTRKSTIGRCVESITLLLAATLVYLLLGELGVRIATHAPLLEFRDFRHERGAKTINSAVAYDSILGWRLRPYIQTESFNTLEYGFRSNGDGRDKVLSGGILVVGSSFTAGSEVTDAETWPAQLQQITNRNVNNGGQGNYSADQIIMIGEELIRIVHPQVLIVDLIPDNILGVKYSSYAWPKPYFTVERGALLQHNVPVPEAPEFAINYDPFGIKQFLGHFVVADQFMNAFFADAWFSSDKQRFIRAINDEASVTCHLLGRLKRQADAANVRLLISMQYGSELIIKTSQRDDDVLLVEDCASLMGIQVIDEFATAKQLYASYPDKFKAMYVTEPNGTLGHKSASGNLEVAKSVAAALAKPPLEIKSSETEWTRAHSEFPAQWQLVIDTNDLSTLFSTSSIIKVEASKSFLAKPVYLLTTVGPKSEHYVATTISEGNGTLRFSAEVRAKTSSKLRLQLISVVEGVAHGVMADFDLGQANAVPWRVGQGRNIDAGIERAGAYWYKLWTTVELPPEKRTISIIVQLASATGDYDFMPDGETLDLRHITVERALPGSG